MSDGKIVVYLSEANLAVAYVKRSLKFGAGNKWDDAKKAYEVHHEWAEGVAMNMGYPRPLAKVAGLFMYVIGEARVIAMRMEDGAPPPMNGAHSGINRIRQVANDSIKWGVGNCGEQAAISFTELYNRGVRPLDYMWLTNRKHAFVVIGRKSDSGEDPSAWGDEAVICDPWNNDAYQLMPEMARSTLLAKMQCGCCDAKSQFRID